MKREKEFRAYLQKNKISTKNVGYCRDHIEKAFGGKDMDEIIAKHQNISAVHNKLKGVGEPANSINVYMVALNHYLQFAIEQGKQAMFVVPPVISSASKKTTNKSTIFDPFAVIADIMIKNGVKSGRKYASIIIKIMKEMGIQSIQELNQRIGEMIINCDDKIREAQDDKERKKYRDARSALKKYSDLLEYEELNDREPGFQEDFDEAWVKDLYIRYDKGWQSFRPVSEHDVGYTIIGDQIIVATNVFFNPGNSYGVTISRSDMIELISILNEAYRYDLFADSNSCIKTIHGKISSYQYSYRGRNGIDCNGLFKDGNRSNTLKMRYINLISKLINI